MSHVNRSNISILSHIHRLIPRSWWSSNGLNRGFILIILGVSPDTPHWIFFFLQIYWENAKFQCKKKGIIHSHRDLNSVSSSTDKTNLLGPIPSRLRSPAPRVRTRAAASRAGGSTSLSLKPAARNSLELISIATGGRDVSTSGVHSWNVSPDASSSTLFHLHCTVFRPVWFVTNHAWHRVAFALMVCRFGLLNEVTVGGEVFECCFCFVQKLYHGSLALLSQVIFTVAVIPPQSWCDPTESVSATL